MTSHDVVNRIRRLVDLRRVGHAGTLDPMATGVLLVCVGRTTRLVEYLIGQQKTYVATVRLGQTTNTYDAEGVVITERSPNNVTSDQLLEALSSFRGPIQQRPPVYSAIKQKGQPLYKLARKGINVEPALRQVIVYELTLVSWQPPDCSLRLTCSSGTYVRSLAHDLGQILGCGGHLTTLRRTAIGDFNIGASVPLAALNDDNVSNHLQPSDAAVAHLPPLTLSAPEAELLKQGQRIERQRQQLQASLARAYDPTGQFIGIVAAADQLWRPRKIFHPPVRA